MPTLHWIGKEKVINHHLDVPYKVLDHSYGFNNGQQQENITDSGNKIIHGDNLEALKALLPEYEGRIKCIYIDPPYNTGNENWVYNDNVSDPKIKKWLHSVVGKEGEDLSRHDKWLCMMYPRLKLLHKLLAEDGAIFISIDDNEQANLKLICDEIFGSGNFITKVIWQKSYAPKSSAKYFSEDHEYVFVYTKSAHHWIINPMPRTDKQDKAYKNPDNDARGAWRPNNLAARNFYSKGTYSIKTPGGRIVAGPPAGSYWRYSEEKFQELDKDNRIWWGKDKNGVPAPKIFLNEVKQGVVPQTLWQYNEVGHSQEAKKEIIEILNPTENELVFTTPKPVRLIERVLQLSTNENAIVLDSFAGSGTTAHAVLNLNKQDNGNRKFILIEMEDYAETITAERVKRVMNGYGDTAGTGGSFDFYTLGQPLFSEDGNLNESVGTTQIRKYIYYTETKGALAEVEQAGNDYYLGTNNDTAYYFYYRPDAITTLNHDFLTSMKARAGQYVIYADNCLLTKAFMAARHIIFKKIPRDVTRF